MSVFSNLYFSIFILSIIVFVDVLVKFKNSNLLKFFFLLLPFSIAVVSLINSLSAIQFVYFIAFFKVSLAISILNIFSILYFPKFKKGSLSVSIFMFSVVLFLILVNSGILPRNPILNSFVYVSIDSELNIIITPMIRLIRFSFIFIVAAHLFYFWYVIYNKLNLNNIYFEKIRNWTTLIFTLSIIVILSNMAIAFVSDKPFWLNNVTIFICFSLLLLVLKRPSFLNTSAKKIAFGHKFNFEHEIEIEELTFLQLFQVQKYFAKKDATLEDLAIQLKVSSQHLSQFIQKKYAMSFSDLVNKNRVNYFFEIVQDPSFQNFTIDALAREVGFSSRQHLNKPFKKFHGGNPSDLVESVISND